MKLFIYEHCPYCVRPRLAAAAKNLSVDLTILANDDEKTHFDLVGKKIVPILEKDDGTRITESLDICHYFDQLNDQPRILPSTEKDDAFRECINYINQLARALTFPRQIFHPMNYNDFPTSSAKAYFRAKKEAMLGCTFEYALTHSKKEIEAIIPPLQTLDAALTHTYATSEQFSWDDIILFPGLRSLTIAQDVLTLPPNIMRYLDRLSTFSGVQLYPRFDFDSYLKAESK